MQRALEMSLTPRHRHSPEEHTEGRKDCVSVPELHQGVGSKRNVSRTGDQCYHTRNQVKSLGLRPTPEGDTHMGLSKSTLALSGEPQAMTALRTIERWRSLTTQLGRTQPRLE